MQNSCKFYEGKGHGLKEWSGGNGAWGKGIEGCSDYTIISKPEIKIKLHANFKKCSNIIFHTKYLLRKSTFMLETSPSKFIL